MSQTKNPDGDLTTRTLAMPADTNPAGDIFGGWLLSQMDIAGGICAGIIAKQRVVTVSVDSMSFHLAVHVGDVVCCYVKEIKRGTTSVTLKIEVWSSKQNEEGRNLVTEGIFKYVCLDENRKPTPIV